MEEGSKERIAEALGQMIIGKAETDTEVSVSRKESLKEAGTLSSTATDHHLIDRGRKTREISDGRAGRKITDLL